MLVLTRKVNQKIVISGKIVVTVVAVDRRGVQIGVEAPPDVVIDREEVAKRR